MNTPAHAIINLYILARDSSHPRTAVILAGALIPDLVIILFYCWHLIQGTSEQQIWEVEYYQPVWQAWIDSFNSIPIFMLAIYFAWRARQPLLLVFFASLLLHSLGDLPLHRDDAHRHFFPFSDWRFASPVSYWDPAHHGRWAAWVEIFAVLAASGLIYRRRPLLRIWITVTLTIYLVYWIYVYLVWI